MRSARVLLSCFLTCTAAIPTAAPAEIAKLPEPYQTLAELARGAPPEFTADALLRLVEQGRLVDKNARRELIEEAFRNAASAKFQVRMRGLPRTTTDTRSGSLSRAYDLKLDALSLQSRAVRDMLPLDPAEARKLFTEIARPTLAPLSCDGALYYDFTDFYEALSAVANGSFTQKERAKDEHLNFLTDYLGQATSALELAPLAGVIQSAGVTAQQRQGLWARLGGMMESMQSDDRSYSASLLTLSALHAPEIENSLEKYRQKSHGCEADAPVAKNTNETPKLDSYWKSTSSQKLLQPGRKLRYDKNNLPLSEADRSTPEWQEQVADYLNQIADWTPDQEGSEADYYHEKCTVLTALIELVPPGAQDDGIIASYVDFISNSDLYQQSPAEWYLEPHTLLDRFQPGTAMRQKLLDAFQRSGNPVLSLEVAFERSSAKR